MSEPPYTPRHGKIEKYLEKIKEVGVPEKVNRAWLRSVGFRSGNDAYVIKVWKHIGFIDGSNVPTELWRRYRVPAQSKAVLAQAIRSGYSGLFGMYEDAYRKDREALYSYFSSQTNKAESTINLMVKTFNSLCDLAEFEALPEVAVPVTAPVPEPIAERPREERPTTIPRGVGLPQVHINIQLHLPETSDQTVYDNLFKSLKKHLFPDEE